MVQNYNSFVSDEYDYQVVMTALNTFTQAASLRNIRNALNFTLPSNKLRVILELLGAIEKNMLSRGWESVTQYATV